jgi:hypothetical protein
MTNTYYLKLRFIKIKIMKNLGIIFKIFFTFVVLAVFSFVKAASIPVENVFSDISSSYKYYHELQTLYDK